MGVIRTCRITQRVVRSALALLLLATALVLMPAASGCTSRGSQDASDGAGEAASGTPSSDASESAGNTQDEPLVRYPVDSVPVGLYFLQGDVLGYAEQIIPVTTDPKEKTASLATKAIEALLEGVSSDEAEWGFSTALPAAMKLVSARVEGGVATVSLSGGLGPTSDAEIVSRAAAQVVFTLTGIEGIERVVLEIGGTKIRGADGSSGTPVALVRNDFDELRPRILITSPAPGTSIVSPVRVEGEASTDSGTFVIEVVGPDGQTVTEQLVDSGSSRGVWTDFEATVEFGADSGEGELVAYAFASDGTTRVFEVHVPVGLAR